MTELALALDVASKEQAKTLIIDLAKHVDTIKLGYESIYRFGSSFVEQASHFKPGIFLDLKLNDIPNTMTRCLDAFKGCHVKYLTMHASAGARGIAAVKEKSRQLWPDSKLLAVTVLTSLNQDDLWSMGFSNSVDQTAGYLTDVAYNNGADGIVCSVLEAEKLRREYPELLLVCPGIRPIEVATDDQVRVATPEYAVQVGVDLAVVGRAITKADNPKEAAKKIRTQLSSHS